MALPAPGAGGDGQVAGEVADHVPAESTAAAVEIRCAVAGGAEPRSPTAAVSVSGPVKRWRV